MKLFHLSLILSLLAVLYTGCSGGSQSPTLPDLAGLSIPDTNPIFVSDWDANGNPTAGQGTLGYFSLAVDPENLTADLTPLRNSALIDTLEIIDITNFMQLAPCNNCVKVNGVSLTAEGYPVVNIGIRHPFPVGNPAEPPSGKNRAELHVFNVEGIVVSNLAGINFLNIAEKSPGFRLVNAHGYTDYLDAALESILPTNATIHPYRMHFRNYSQGNFDPSSPTGFTSVVNPLPSGYNVMPMSSPFDYQDYIFDISGPMTFIYAVGCNYAISTTSFTQRFTPEFRCPQHNKKAASEIEMEIVTNNLIASNTASSATLQIKVLDINHGVAVGTALNQMHANSSVDKVYLEIPFVMIGKQTLQGTSSISGTGHDPSSPLVYETTVTNATGAPGGTYTGLVKVTDTYAPGQNTVPGLLDGGARVGPKEDPLTGLFAITEFATFQVFEISIRSELTAPDAQLTSVPTPANINTGQTVQFNATGSTDSDGSIVQYEFDYVWDGIQGNFVADTSNATGIATSSPYNTPGSYTAGVRVTDNDTLVDYASVSVNVNIPPTAVLVKDPDVSTLPQFSYLELDATGSTDADGTIIMYEFDYDWDGTPAGFTTDWADPSGVVEAFLVNDGSFTIGVRVSDNSGAFGYDSVSITITPRDVIFCDANNTEGPWDGSYGNPYQTVQDGVNAASNNSYIWIRPGAYKEDPGGAPTSADAEVTISSLSGLTLYGEDYPRIGLHFYAGVDEVAGIHADNCDNLTIQGIHIFSQGGYRSAIWVTNSDGVTIDGCNIDPGTPAGTTQFNGFINAISCPNLQIINNNLVNPVFGLNDISSAFLMNLDDCDNALISLNTVTEFAIEMSSSTPGNHASFINLMNSQDIEISKNTFGTSTITAVDPVFTFTILNLDTVIGTSVIRNNLLYGISLANDEISVSDLIGIYSFESTLSVYNNTLHGLANTDSAGTTAGLLFETPTSPVAYNNIFTYFTAPDISTGYKRVGGDAFTVTYSDVWNLISTSVVRFDNVTEGTGGINTNPSYVNAATGDFHLQSGSPCEGTGQGGTDMGCYGGTDPLP